MSTVNFGLIETSDVHLSEPNRMAGLLRMERANVRWFLSTDADDLPSQVVEQGATTTAKEPCHPMLERRQLPRRAAA